MLRPISSKILRAAALFAAVALAGCTEGTTLSDISPKAEKKLPEKVLTAMKAKGMERDAPVMARIFKEEGKLEVWKQKTNGRYDLISSYDICKWSGELGPKYIEGDRQAPEGFYTVRPAQMNPRSSFHLAFNMGFPNAYDRANGRAGANLMVHGACSSSGCYSMTDAQMEEIYAFGRDAFRGGQTEFQIQAFPFRMTAANMARYRDDPNYQFWTMLKEGYDHFEITKVPPKVDVCERRYVFNRSAEGDAKFDPTGACPPSTQPQSLVSAYQSFQTTYTAAFSSAAKASPAPPKASINGIQEAKLVANWSRAKARGERVTIEPPSMGIDGTVVASSSRMGRVDTPEARRLAAAEAAATEKAKAAEAKKAIAQAKAEQQKAAAVAAAAPPPEPAVTGGIPSPAVMQPEAAGQEVASGDKPGLLGSARKRLKNIFGS